MTVISAERRLVVKAGRNAPVVMSVVMTERRAGAWSRRQARRLHLKLVREQWHRLVAVITLWAVAIVGVTIAAPHQVSSFVLGAGMASACWSLAWIVSENAGARSHRLGAWGEGWTSEALRKLRKHGWRLVEHVPLTYGDVDHVLIGPGGVYAIETKTTARPREWNVDEPDRWLRRAVTQARHRAERVQRILLERETRVRTDVHPLLVLWGPMQGTTEEIEGVRVLHGSDLVKWQEQLTTDALDREAVERAASGLERFVATRDEHIRASGGMGGTLVEHGPARLLSQLASGVLGGIVALFAIGMGLRVLPDTALLPLLMVALVASVVVRRSGHLRLPALGWAAMSACLTTTLAAAYVWSWAA